MWLILQEDTVKLNEKEDEKSPLHEVARLITNNWQKARYFNTGMNASGIDSNKDEKALAFIF